MFLTTGPRYFCFCYSRIALAKLQSTVQLSRCFERSRICALRVIVRRGLSLLASHSQTSRNHARSSRKRAKPVVKHARRESDCEMRDLYYLREVYIDRGYRLEPPRLAEAVLTCTHILCFEQK